MQKADSSLQTADERREKFTLSERSESKGQESE